jgi:16S rRNA (cytosine1402-N4)-methyltransferase
MFQTYGEVRNARQLAHHIVTNRSKSMLATVGSFKTIIQPVVKGLPNRYLAQVFQALRIEVNDEMGALKDLLTQSASMLAPGGRLVVITFHSGEDRLVKQFIKKGNWDVEGEDLDPYGRKPILGQLRPINTKPIEPSEAELVHNPRARSAKLRIAEKAIA